MPALTTDTFEMILADHRELGRLLEALVRVSGRQTEALHPDEFLTLLDHKQRLLDAVSAREPQALFEQAEREEWALRRAGRTVDADAVRAAAQENRGRVDQLQQREATAREVWQQRRDRLRDTLVSFSRQTNARRRYVPASAAAPRFLNASL